MVGEQHLVAGGRPHRLQHQRHGRRGVRHERAAFRIRTEKRGQVPAGVLDPVVQPLGEELERIRLGLVTQPLLGALHADRDGAVRPVIEVGHRRIEREQETGSGDRRGRAHIWMVRVRRLSGPGMRLPERGT
jgi:hypothetical protein